MNLFQRYLAEEFAEDYVEGRISRRQALKLIASVTGSLVAATSILAACVPEVSETPSPGAMGTLGAPVTGEDAATATASPGQSANPDPTLQTTATLPAQSATGETPQGTPEVYGTVSPDDPAVSAGEVEFEGNDGATLFGYLTSPVDGEARPVVLVCHENRGLTVHIQDVTRRLAKAGYTGLAVDLLSRQGGSQSLGQDEVPGVLGNIDPDQFVEDFRSGLNYLQGQPAADTSRVGMVGFCFGGGVTWRAATQLSELKAAVPYYGPHPPVEDVPNIQAAVLAIYGERDTRINQGIPTIEEAMNANNKIFEYMIYPNADHAFHNDTTNRYNPEAARDAWQRTLRWFGQYLG